MTKVRVQKVFLFLLIQKQCQKIPSNEIGQNFQKNLGALNSVVPGAVAVSASAVQALVRGTLLLHHTVNNLTNFFSKIRDLGVFLLLQLFLNCF